jgi:hypothetical protein
LLFVFSAIFFEVSICSEHFIITNKVQIKTAKAINADKVPLNIVFDSTDGLS